MTYKFTCESCGSEENIEMKMSEYTSEGHTCSKCGGELKRSMSSYTTASAIWKCSGAYGINRD